jgi:hypothetical protein
MTVIRLADAVAGLASFDESATIYAAEPWNAESAAVIATEPESGGLPEGASPRGLKYFLEVSIARDFLEGWEATLSGRPSEQERCARLIRYAIDDA